MLGGIPLQTTSCLPFTLLTEKVGQVVKNMYSSLSVTLDK